MFIFCLDHTPSQKTMMELKRKSTATKWACMLSTLENEELALLANGQYPFMSVTKAPMSITFAGTPDLYGCGVNPALEGGGGGGVHAPDRPDPVMSI